MRRPEVLAPAGDRACLEAAVLAGADAVYFGLQAFNARARATNFDARALRETMGWLHERGARGYVTLNTLIFDHELGAVEATLRACAEAGVDAIICQDLGLLRLAAAVAPSLPVHASTQMTCTDAGSVRLAASLGAKRVILARELSLADIGAIRAETDIELEVFVHGALCVAYSGQCLTSEAIGGRSANRGACAQACRLPYELVVDGVIRDLGEQAYLLSPQDLETSRLVPELVALGVSSLKIEGRLKGPDYVAATTRLYRQAIAAAMGDGDAPDEATRLRALQAYSRGSGPGFLNGVDHQQLVDGRGCEHRGIEAGKVTIAADRRGLVMIQVGVELARGDGLLFEGGREGEGEVGGRVWRLEVGGEDVERAKPGARALVWLGRERDLSSVTVGTRVFRTSAPRVFENLDAAEARRIRLDLTLRGQMGERPTLTGTAAGYTEEVSLETPLEVARNTPVSLKLLREKLGRLGDTSFELGTLTVKLPEEVMLPMSALNRARRALTDRLRAAIDARHHGVVAVDVPSLLAAAEPSGVAAAGGLFVLCRTLEQAEAACDAGADGVYLDFLELTGTGAAVRALRARPGPRVHVTVAPPRIRKPGEEKIDQFLAGLDADAVLVRGLGALAEPSGTVPRIGDFSLNVTNRLTAIEVLRHGLSAFTPSFDLDATQLEALLTPSLAPFAEVVLHHPMPLFHMEHCLFAALLSDGKDHRTCGRPCDRHKLSLRDRAGMDHPVEADVGCRNTVFHAAAQSAAQLVPKLQAAGVRRFRAELVRESAADVARIVAAYRALLDGKTPVAEVWRTLRVDQGYGVGSVVKGSLRVL